MKNKLKQLQGHYEDYILNYLDNIPKFEKELIFIKFKIDHDFNEYFVIEIGEAFTMLLVCNESSYIKFQNDNMFIDDIYLASLIGFGDSYIKDRNIIMGLSK